jgi:hypothetical protein
MRARGGNVSASVFRTSLPASARRAHGCGGCYPAGASPVLRSRRGPLVERIGSASQSFRCTLQPHLGASRRHYPYAGAGAPQVCPVYGRIVRARDWGLTRSGLAHDRTCPRRLLHCGGRGAGVWRVLPRLLRISSRLWARRLRQAHSSVGYRAMTCSHPQSRPSQGCLTRHCSGLASLADEFQWLGGAEPKGVGSAESTED